MAKLMIQVLWHASRIHTMNEKSYILGGFKDIQYWTSKQYDEKKWATRVVY